MIPNAKPTFDEYRDLWLSYLLRYLPVTWASAIGAYGGARYGRRGIARGRLWAARLRRNFERFDGISDPAEQDRRIVEFTRSIGRIYTEITVLKRLVAQGRVDVVGREHLRGLSRPAIIATCHLGNWELAGHVMSLLDGGTCVLYAGPDNAIHQRLAERARLDWQAAPRPQLLLPSPGAMRQITRAIASGRNLLMFVDEVRDEYIWAPSLGRSIPEAGNRWLTARLAVRFGLDIVPMHVQCTGLARYRIIIAPKLAPGSGEARARVRALAGPIDQCFDAWIRAHPEQWLYLRLFEPDRPPPGNRRSPGR
jgi:lauroyl/myristoyl acyltransferase